jgi:hypothetical protein
MSRVCILVDAWHVHVRFCCERMQAHTHIHTHTSIHMP